MAFETANSDNLAVPLLGHDAGEDETKSVKTNTWRYRIQLAVVILAVITVSFILGSLAKWSTDDDTPEEQGKAAVLLCEDAEPQAPRDLSTGATGLREPKAHVMTMEQSNQLYVTNVHFHLGAEHKSDFYNIPNASDAYDQGRSEDKIRPGFMCDTSSFTSDQLKEYTFQHCEDVEVGRTYEVHYVSSSAGTKDGGLKDGLGVAAAGRGLANPMIVVKAMVYLVVDDEAFYQDDLLSNFDTDGALMYAGSTTGPSYNNEVCSPYTITWHVSPKCTTVSASAFDKLCQDMVSNGEVKDVAPHASRLLVAEEWASTTVSNLM